MLSIGCNPCLEQVRGKKEKQWKGRRWVRTETAMGNWNGQTCAKQAWSCYCRTKDSVSAPVFERWSEIFELGLGQQCMPRPTSPGLVNTATARYGNEPHNRSHGCGTSSGSYINVGTNEKCREGAAELPSKGFLNGTILELSWIRADDGNRYQNNDWEVWIHQFHFVFEIVFSFLKLNSAVSKLMVPPSTPPHHPHHPFYLKSF